MSNKAHKLTRAIPVAALLALAIPSTPALACELDGLPGMHRYNPFLRYQRPDGPLLEPEPRAPQSERTQPGRGSPRPDAPEPARKPADEPAPKAWDQAEERPR